MKESDYVDFVCNLVKPGEDVIKTLTPEKVDLWHMGTGVSGEAGELLDAIKKYVIYNKPLDVENIKEELGDLKFYMTKIMKELNITDEDLRVINHKKLIKRYEKGYSDKAAQERKDKQ